MNTNAEQLFERYRRRGDVAALADVFDRTAPEILRVAMHLARDPADAEELLQETFLAAIRRAETFDATRPLVPWLLGILTNLARNARRKRGRRPDADRLAARAQGAQSPPIESREVRDAVSSAVDGIPEPYRAVLVLHLTHGLSPVQIAHALGLPPATVRSQLQRGLRQVRERLPRSVAPRALTALPLTGGLAGVREAVLTEGQVLALAVPTTTALVLGGLIVTKKTLAAGAALLCLVLAAGGTYLALDGTSDEGAAERSAPDLTAARVPVETSEETGPTLSAGGHAPSASASASPTRVATSSSTPKRLPLDTAIPAGKGSVAGTLHFEDGTPVQGVKVALWGASPVEDVTDAEGFFHLHGDWVAGRQLYVKGERRFDAVILQHVAMKADELVRVAFTIQRGHEFVGTVKADEDGSPIPNTLVILRRPGSNGSDDTQAGYASHRTDDEGRFHFRYLPAASYTVMLDEPGFESFFGRVEIREAMTEAAYRMKRSRPFRVVFQGLADEAEGAPVSWSFRLIDRGGMVYAPDGKSKLGPGGTLRLDAPPTGKYHLVLSRSKFTDRFEKPIDVGAEQGEPLVIPRVVAARIEGVLHDAHGKPVADTRIQIGPSGVRTNAEGAFVVERSPLGRLSAFADFESGWVMLSEVSVASAGSLQVQLTMPGSSILKGRVLKERTQFGNGHLWSRGERRRQVAVIVPDAEGRFVVPHLAAGSYEFQWTQTGAEPLRRDVELVVGSTTDLGDLEPAALPRVPLTVIVPRGSIRPTLIQLKLRMGPATVSASGATSQSVYHAGTVRLDSAGRGAITTLQPGTWHLIFSAAPFADVEVDLIVVKGGNEPLEISLEQP